jgi:hypothetical protein
MEEQIKAYAELVIKELRAVSGIDFGYTQESVEWLDGYINRLRDGGMFENVETKNKLINGFGSFLGECVIRCHGGTWKLHESGAWCVVLENGGMAFPFTKVRKQIEDGPFDSISSYFRVIPIIFDEVSEAAPSVPKKPWWKLW